MIINTEKENEKHHYNFLLEKAGEFGVNCTISYQFTESCNILKGDEERCFPWIKNRPDNCYKSVLRAIGDPQIPCPTVHCEVSRNLPFKKK